MHGIDRARVLGAGRQKDTTPLEGEPHRTQAEFISSDLRQGSRIPWPAKTMRTAGPRPRAWRVRTSQPHRTDLYGECARMQSQQTPKGSVSCPPKGHSTISALESPRGRFPRDFFSTISIDGDEGHQLWQLAVPMHMRSRNSYIYGAAGGGLMRGARWRSVLLNSGTDLVHTGLGWTRVPLPLFELCMEWSPS